MGLEAPRLLPELGEEPERELPAEHRRRLEDAAAVVGQPLDAAREHLLERVRDPERAGASVLLAHGERELLEEQGVPLGLGHDDRGERRRRLGGLEHGPDDARAVGDGQRLERDLGRVGLLDPRGAIPGPVREDEEDRRARQALDQGAEVLVRRLVDPVDVLDREDERAPPTALQAELALGLEGARLDRFRAQDGQALRPVADAEELQEIRRALGGVHADLLEAAADLLDDRLRAVRIDDPAVRAQDVEERQVRDGAAVGQAASLDVADVRPQGLAELVEQPALAEPRLADDADHLAAPGDGRVEAALQELEIVPAADEGREAARRPGLGALPAEEPEHRPGDPVHRPDGDQVQPALQERRDPRRQQHASRLRLPEERRQQELDVPQNVSADLGRSPSPATGKTAACRPTFTAYGRNSSRRARAVAVWIARAA